MRPQARHDEIRRQVKHHIAHVEQRQTCRDLVRGEVEHGAQVVACVFVHGLREADVRADRGAEEVEDPEGGDYAVVEFSVSLAGSTWQGIGGWWGMLGAYRYMRSMLAMSGSSPVSAIAWSGYGSGSGCSWALVVVTFFATLSGGILYAIVAVSRQDRKKRKE